MSTTAPAPIRPSGKLTVLIRDLGPLQMDGSAPRYRTVRLHLTAAQVEDLMLDSTHMSNGEWHFEEIAQVIWEDHP